MFEGLSFEQFGVASVLFVLMSGVIVVVYRNWMAERNKVDEIQEKRLQDAKQVHDSLSAPLSQQVTLTKQIYDILLSRNKGE